MVWTALPLSWVLVQNVMMRTTVDLRTSWDQGYASVYQYGFPLPFTHWGLVSSTEYSHFLGPLLLDWIVYLVCVTLVLRLVLRMLCPPPQVLKVVSVILWGWALWTAFLVALDVGLGGVTWTTQFSVLEKRDAVLSWARGLDGYGP